MRLSVLPWPEPLCHHLDFNLVERTEDVGEANQEEDMMIVRLCAEAVPPMYVKAACSRLGLYGS